MKFRAKMGNFYGVINYSDQFIYSDNLYTKITDDSFFSKGTQYNYIVELGDCFHFNNYDFALTRVAKGEYSENLYLKDINNKVIYELDIVKYKNELFLIEFNFKENRYVLTNGNTQLLFGKDVKSKDLLVVSNAFETDLEKFKKLNNRQYLYKFTSFYDYSDCNHTSNYDNLSISLDNPSSQDVTNYYTVAHQLVYNPKTGKTCAVYKIDKTPFGHIDEYDCCTMNNFEDKEYKFSNIYINNVVIFVGDCVSLVDVNKVGVINYCKKELAFKIIIDEESYDFNNEFVKNNNIINITPDYTKYINL